MPHSRWEQGAGNAQEVIWYRARDEGGGLDLEERQDPGQNHELLCNHVATDKKP